LGRVSMMLLIPNLDTILRMSESIGDTGSWKLTKSIGTVIVAAVLKDALSQITIFQNSDDPFSGTNLVSSIHEMNRADHEYPYFNEFNKFLV